MVKEREGKKTSFQKSMIELRMVFIGNSPVVQWLRHCTFDAKGPGSSPGGETKVPQAVPQSNPPPQKSGLHLVLFLSVPELKLKVVIQGPTGPAEK